MFDNELQQPATSAVSEHIYISSDFAYWLLMLLDIIYWIPKVNLVIQWQPIPHLYVLSPELTQWDGYAYLWRVIESGPIL